MKKEPGIKWLFMDLNSYFASVEQQENPALRGKAIAVTPMDTDYTCAIAASYEAKLYGIKTGTMIKDAKRMCPHLICVPARHDRYVLYHNRIIEEVIKHTPINRIWSIDELSSRLPPNKRNIDAAQKIAVHIKNGLWQHVGEAINCSIGFAPNSLLAKIACEMHKPDGMTILTQEELPGRLLDLKLTDLPGIGGNMEKRLRRAGISSVEDFWNVSPKHARKIWGNVQGERFWYLLHGYDFETPETQTSMVGHSRVLDPELRTPDKARLIARKLAAKAANRLRNKGYFTRTIYLSARTKCGFKWGDALSLPATQDPFVLLRYVDILWHAMMRTLRDHSGTHTHRISIKKVSVCYRNLVVGEMVTDDLFISYGEKDAQLAQKTSALTEALDHLQRKYQKDVVSVGICPKTSAGYLAVTRLPKLDQYKSYKRNFPLSSEDQRFQIALNKGVYYTKASHRARWLLNVEGLHTLLNA